MCDLVGICTREGLGWCVPLPSPPATHPPPHKHEAPPPNFRCTVYQFTPNGRHLICGSLDGLVEVYDYESGKVDTSLEFQEKVC